MTEPTFSIVVPTHARPARLADCLTALGALDYPLDAFEVLVIDDGSPAPVDDVVRAVAGDLKVTLKRQANSGPAAARNAGAALAKGRYVVFTDDDCRPRPEWLTVLEAKLQVVPDRLIGGRVDNALPGNLYAIASHLILDTVYAFYNEDVDCPTFFASSNMAMGRELFHEVGGFDDGFRRAAAEDRDFCDRWLLAGHLMAHEPLAIVDHRHDMTLLGFCRQNFNYGRGAWQYHRRCAKRRSSKFRDHLAFHKRLPRLLRQQIRTHSFGERCGLVLLLGLWQVSNGCGFVFEKLVGRNRRPLSTRSPVDSDNVTVE